MSSIRALISKLPNTPHPLALPFSTAAHIAPRASGGQRHLKSSTSFTELLVGSRGSRKRPNIVRSSAVLCVSPHSSAFLPNTTRKAFYTTSSPSTMPQLTTALTKMLGIRVYVLLLLLGWPSLAWKELTELCFAQSCYSRRDAMVHAVSLLLGSLECVGVLNASVFACS
jgi:hypothetical protein